MALSPWLVAPILSFEDVACVLAGYADSEDYNERSQSSPELRRQASNVIKWKHQIMEAAGREDLEVERVFLHGFPSGGDRNKMSWFEGDHIDLIMGIFDYDQVRVELRREEVSRWLLSSGVKNDDIPTVLREGQKTEKKAPYHSPDLEERPVHPRRRRTYLTLIEALVLEVLDGDLPTEPYKAAGVLQAIMECRGLKLDKDPIASTVKEIQVIREDRESERV